jgi:hypothetical protein
MSGNPCIQCRVSPETKERLRALASEHQVTESVLLKRLVEKALQPLGMAASQAMRPMQPVSRSARIFVRLRPEDQLLLRERASARGLPAATYVSMLVRAHLRTLNPVPDREMAEIERAVSALGAIGRNLNQIARVAHQTARVTGPSTQDLQALLRACTALRDHLKAFITVNVASWEAGHEEARP